MELILGNRYTVRFCEVCGTAVEYVCKPDEPDLETCPIHGGAWTLKPPSACYVAAVTEGAITFATGPNPTDSLTFVATEHKPSQQ
jgi:hypothetical protein